MWQNKTKLLFKLHYTAVCWQQILQCNYSSETPVPRAMVKFGSCTSDWSGKRYFWIFFMTKMTKGKYPGYFLRWLTGGVLLVCWCSGSFVCLFFLVAGFVVLPWSAKQNKKFQISVFLCRKKGKLEYRDTITELILLKQRGKDASWKHSFKLWG